MVVMDMYKEAHRIAQEKYRAANPEKVKARTAVAYAIKRGKLVKEPCIRCKSLKVQAHHSNYNTPLEVSWLCSKCHGKVHVEMSLMGIDVIQPVKIKPPRYKSKHVIRKLNPPDGWKVQAEQRKQALAARVLAKKQI